MFRNILVPTDGSALSHKAIKKAVQLAKEQNARVVGFHVAPPYEPNVSEDYVSPHVVSPRQYAENVKKRAMKHLDVIKKTADEAGVTCACAYATSEFPYAEIVKAARSNDCDLIFMASHGRRGISRLRLGSETAKVLAHSAVPVMVCR